MKCHTIAEELKLPAVQVMASLTVGEKAAKYLNLVALSNVTVNKRIDKISDNEKTAE